MGCQNLRSRSTTPTWALGAVGADGGIGEAEVGDDVHAANVPESRDAGAGGGAALTSMRM